jgi:isoamylase
MLLHGDELGRTQQGNNNTYAQDSELSWVHWDQVDEPLVEFTAALIELRRQHPTFRRRRFFTGNTVRTGPAGAERLNDIVWLHLEGRPMEDADWESGNQALGMYLNGHGIAGSDARGGTILDDHFLLYFNADGEAEVTLPPAEYADAWDVVIDTGGTPDEVEVLPAGSTLTIREDSVLVLREYVAATVEPDHSVAASVAATVASATAARA